MQTTPPKQQNGSSSHSADVQRTLIQWIKTFNLSSNHQCESLADLCDGILLFEILFELEPQHFDLTLIGTDLDDGGDEDERLLARIKNLEALLQGLDQGFESIFGQAVDLTSSVMAGEIARSSDGTDVLPLLELVLLFSVKCPAQATVVQGIMELAPDHQTNMMTLIQAVSARYQLKVTKTPHKSTRRDSIESLASDLSSPSSSPFTSPKASRKPSLAETPGGQAIHQEDVSRLSRKMAELQRDHQDQAATINQLQQAAKQHDSTRHELEKQIAQARDDQERAVSEACERVRGECVEKTQAETGRLRKQIDFEKAHQAELKQQLAKLETDRQSLSKRLSEESERRTTSLRALQDKLDIAEDKAAQVSQLEATLARYRAKMEAMSQMKQQLADTEAHHMSQTDRVIALEDELRQIPKLESKLGRTKDELVEATAKLGAVEAQNQQFDKELDRLKRENLALVSENSGLQAQAQAHLDDANQAMQQSSLAAELNGANALAETVTPELREKLRRLEADNASLLAAAQTSPAESARLADLDDELDTHKRMALQFQRKFQDSQAEVAGLRAQLERTQTASVSRTKAAAEQSHFVAAEFAATQEAHTIVAKASGQGIDAQVTALQAALKDKAKELAQCERQRDEQASESASAQAQFQASESRVSKFESRNKTLQEYVKKAQVKLKQYQTKLRQLSDENQLEKEQRITLVQKNSELEGELFERTSKLDSEAQGLLADKNEQLSNAKREIGFISRGFFNIGLQLQKTTLENRGLRRQAKPNQSWLGQERNKLDSPRSHMS